MSRSRAAVAPLAARKAAALPAAPLPSGVRADFERRFDADFTRVQVHSGPEAGLLAASLGANAFAAGDHIVFGDGRFAPGTTAGRTLLAHELAHVAQQQRRTGAASPPAAAEGLARGAASRAMRGGDVASGELGRAEPGVQCEDEEKKPALPPPSSAGAPAAALPELPRLKLDPIDWSAMREPMWKRGLPFDLKDGDSVRAEWRRGAGVLEALGIGEGFKLGPITRDWILNKGISKQLEDVNARDNPTEFDRMNKAWKDAHPGGWETPIVPIPWLSGEF